VVVLLYIQIQQSYFIRSNHDKLHADNITTARNAHNLMCIGYRILEALIHGLYSSNQAMTPTGVNEAGKPSLNTDQKIQN